MGFHLVKFEADYADEFNVTGVRLFEDWDEWQKEMKAIEYPYKWNFGSNEGIEFDSWVDFISHFEVYTISREEADFLSRTGLDNHGHFPEY